MATCCKQVKKRKKSKKDGLAQPPLDLSFFVKKSCCGFEFGFDDESEADTFSEYRQRWINEGFPFFNAKKKEGRDVIKTPTPGTKRLQQKRNK